LIGIPGMLASPVTGAARSILGHGMASAVAATGELIDPGLAAKDDPRQMYEEAKGGVDQAMMALAPRGATPRGRVPVDSTPSSQQLKQDAVSVYQSPEVKDIRIPPDDVVNLTAGIQNEVLQKGFRPSPGSAPGAFSEIKRMTPGPEVGAVSVDDLRAARRAFGQTAKQVGPDFKATPDAAAATIAIRKIDDFLDTLSPELRSANANYSAGKRADMLDYRTMKADRNAAKSGSGMNMENAMRQAVDKIGDRGLKPAEIAARDSIVLGTGPRNALRTAGKLGVDGGLSLMLHTGAGLGSGGATIPITAAGTAARKFGELLTRRQVAELNKAIRANTPLAQALAASPSFAQLPKRTQALISAIISQGTQRPALGAVVPAYAQEDQ
jgi:hypothetical protein